MREAFPIRAKIEYNSEKLKELIKKAWEFEVAEQEKKLGRPLTEEEKGDIKINTESVNRWHRMGLIPAINTYQKRFGSIINVAKLLELPASSHRPRVTFEARNVGEYMSRIKLYLHKFKQKENRNPTTEEIRQAIATDEIQDVPTTIFNYLDISSILGLERIRKGGKPKDKED